MVVMSSLSNKSALLIKHYWSFLLPHRVFLRQLPDTVMWNQKCNFSSFGSCSRTDVMIHHWPINREPWSHICPLATLPSWADVQQMWYTFYIVPLTILLETDTKLSGLSGNQTLKTNLKTHERAGVKQSCLYTSRVNGCNPWQSPNSSGNSLLVFPFLLSQGVS